MSNAQLDPRVDMRGTTFVELMFAIVIIGVAVMVQIQQVTITLREHQVDVDMQFAYRKAAGMLAELQASVDQGVLASVEAIEAVADAEPNPTLTTRDVPSPDHVMSGNFSPSEGLWRWYRDIDVEPVAGSDRSRYVRIRVYRADDNGHRTIAGVASAILNLTIRAEPYVQEYDVYVLAIAEAPSLWQTLPALRAQMQTVASEVAGANPNLRFRMHWITKLGYGRDSQYVPYVNESTASDAAAPYVYWYPGKMAAGASASTLYSAELISGRVRTESGVLHDLDQDNLYPHAVADRFNHCLRTPDARALFQLRVEAGMERADEPPLQLLLADMHANPEQFRNAIVINLHGAGLPFPPLRNYADAAKDPVNHPGVRVVTHPARLHTPNGRDGSAMLVALAKEIQAAAETESDDAKSHLLSALAKLNAATLLPYSGTASLLEDVQGQLEEAADEDCDAAYALELRVRDIIADLESRSLALGGPELKVYAYGSDPDSGPALLDKPITLQIMGCDLTANVNGISGSVPVTLEIRRVVGGIDPCSGARAAMEYEHFFESAGIPPHPGAATEPYEMRYEVGYSTTPAPHTWIKLYNTPLTAPLVDTGDGVFEGLASKHRLYGLEYVPSPVQAVVRDLDQDGSAPKNTARWRIRIPPSALPKSDTQLTIHTRIGDDLSTGRMWPTAHQPHNLSTTYAWWTDSVEDVPITERYQILGDPRHNPYEDLCVAGSSFPEGYNAWFDDLRNAMDDSRNLWPCLNGERLSDGFRDASGADLPRITQVWRESLQACGAVFVNASGALARHLLMGGEIALPGDAIRASSAVPVPGVLVDPFVTGVVELDEVASRLGFEAILERPIVRTSGGFWSKPWLGELVPEAQFTAYAAVGNLATADGVSRSSSLGLALTETPSGSDWSMAAKTDESFGGGMASMAESMAQADGPTESGGTACALTESVHAFVQSVGLAISPNSMQLPMAKIVQPVLFGDTAVDLLEPLAHLADQSIVSSGIVRAGMSGKAAYFVLLGDTPSSAVEQRAVTYKALAFGLRAFMVAAEPERADCLELMPLVCVDSPLPKQVLVAPQSVQLRWSTAFKRFDGQGYTERFHSDWAGAESGLIYVVTYRKAGDTKAYYADGSAAEIGVLPAGQHQLPDAGPATESFILQMPAQQFPAGQYILRVDCYRRNGKPHLAHHEVCVEVKR